MACIVTFHCVGGRDAKVVRKGSEPRNPCSWIVSAWFVLPSGEKITHSATIRNQTVHGLVPVMGALIDSISAEHGNQVTSAGWSAMMVHGKRK